MSDQVTNGPATRPTVRLLKTKLYIPIPHPELVERPWLLKRFNDSLRCKLTLVSAPAGFGKTTLLSSWFSDRQFPVAWISLDKKDNDPVRFWSYFIAALQTLRPDFGETAQAMLQSTQPPPEESILTELLNEITLFEEDFSLVLDDYHTIHTTAIHNGLTFLLDNLPTHMHLFIATRSDPPLPLPVMRARRELIEINLADLRFTHQEADHFFNQVMKLKLPWKGVVHLADLTEGWIAGLQLAGLSLRGMTDAAQFIQTFSGAHRYIFDYLAQEVLNQQRPEIQSFLLKTSVLDRLSGELCQAVSGHAQSQSLLEELETANLFILTLDQHRHWYRYHHLFAEFLRARLEENASADEITSLHQRASAWYESNGWSTEAVEHALLAENYERAVGLIEQEANLMFEDSELTTLLDWLSKIPAERLSRKPRVSAIYAWALLATGRLDLVEPHLQDIETVLKVKADGSPESFAANLEVQRALAEVSCLRANMAFHQMDFGQVLELSQRALDYLGDDEQGGLYQHPDDIRSVAAFNEAVTHEFIGDVLAASQSFQKAITLSRKRNNAHLLALSNSHLGQLLVLQGQLQQAAQIFQQTLLDSASELAPPSPYIGIAQVGLGQIHYEWNNLDQATALLTEGIERGRRWANWETLLPGYTGLATVKSAQDDLAGAIALYSELDQLAQQLVMPFGTITMAAQRAQLAARHGDFASAAKWVTASNLDLTGEVPFMFESEAIYLARVLLYLGRTAEALSLAERLLANAEEGERFGRMIHILAIQSMALHQQGDEEQAMLALQRALTLGEPQGFVRTFLDEGKPMQDLLARVTGSETVYAQRLLHLFPQSKVGIILNGTGRDWLSQAGVTEVLSERELEVLHLLADGFTNQEIADRLYISLNTVKTHLKNIYGRLDAHNRTQATTRARELGLL